MISGTQDVFITKINSTGSSVVYSTYLGGSKKDYGKAVAVDSSGNAYVCGWTTSNDFPTTSGAYQETTPDSLSNGDAFVCKLDSTGSSLDYCTYVAGTDMDIGEALAVDSSGNAFVCGWTMSSDLPVKDAFQSTDSGGLFAGFVCEFNSTGSTLIYSSFVAGNDGDSCEGIAVDSSGKAYVCGWSSSSDFSVSQGAAQETYGGGEDSFLIGIEPGVCTDCVTCTYSITPTNKTYWAIPSYGNYDDYDLEVDEIEVSAITGCPWVVTSTDNWIYLYEGEYDEYRTGSEIIEYSIKDNKTNSSRTGHIIVKGGTTVLTYTIVQEGICPIDVAEKIAYFKSEGGGGTVSIETSDECSWYQYKETFAEVVAVFSMPKNIAGNVEGKGSQTLSYQVLENKNKKPRKEELNFYSSSDSKASQMVYQPGAVKKMSDLKAGKVKAPKNVKKGKKAKVKAQVKNKGKVSAIASKVIYYLSGDNNKSIGSDDTKLSTKKVKKIRKRKGASSKGKVKIPKKTSNGTFYIKALWNGTYNLNETSIENNVGVSGKVKVE